MSSFQSGGNGGGRGFGGGGGFGGAGGGRRGSKFGRFAQKRREIEPDEPLDYKNIQYLMKFVGPTGKLQSRKRTGFSGQNQRKLAEAVKRARMLALMPFAGRS
jgi:small subunit ribosomal protein S18